MFKTKKKVGRGGGVGMLGVDYKREGLGEGDITLNLQCFC